MDAYKTIGGQDLFREPDYSKLDNALFDSLLKKIIDECGSSYLLTIDGVYDILKETFNNDVLSLFEENYPELAYPNKGKDNA